MTDQIDADLQVELFASALDKFTLHLERTLRANISNGFSLLWEDDINEFEEKQRAQGAALLLNHRVQLLDYIRNIAEGRLVFDDGKQVEVA